MKLSRKQVTPISPFGENFETYIDHGVSTLVKSLVAQGEMVISSCEGHSNFKPRYITVAFNSIDQREQFVTSLTKGLNKASFIVKYLDTLAVEMIDGKEIIHGTRENEIKGCNFLFRKDSDFFCFARVTIGYAFYSEGQTSLSKECYNLFFLSKIFILNYLKRERITRDMEANALFRVLP